LYYLHKILRRMTIEAMGSTVILQLIWHALSRSLPNCSQVNSLQSIWSPLNESMSESTARYNQ
jgi:hypothetical protein